MNSELINLNGTNELISSDKFTSTIDRFIDSSTNEEFKDLILNNKLDFNKENVNLKSLNINDSDFDTKEE